MAKMADLYPRLEEKQQSTLLQILAKQIIVDTQGKIVGHELNSPFVYLGSLVQSVSISGKSSSERFGLMTYKSDGSSRYSESVDEFVASLRFEQRGKLDLVPINNIKSHN
jgi:hypothetical protein